MTEESIPNPIWEFDSTHPTLAEDLRSGLREVIDPEIGLSIIELGLVREVHMQQDTLHLKMILTTPFCPYAPAMIEMTRKKAEETAKSEVLVELGMEMWDPSMMEEGAGAAWGFF